MIKPEIKRRAFKSINENFDLNLYVPYRGYARIFPLRSEINNRRIEKLCGLLSRTAGPNLEENAEKEFIARFIKACDNINVKGFRVVTSDDIYKCEPDFVLVTHEFSRS